MSLLTGYVPTSNGASRPVAGSTQEVRADRREVGLVERRRAEAGAGRAAEDELLHRRVAAGELAVGGAAEVAEVLVTRRPRRGAAAPARRLRGRRRRPCCCATCRPRSRGGSRGTPARRRERGCRTGRAGRRRCTSSARRPRSGSPRGDTPRRRPRSADRPGRPRYCFERSSVGGHQIVAERRRRRSGSGSSTGPSDVFSESVT